MEHNSLFSPDIFLLVVLGDGDIPSIGLEFMLWKLSKGIVLHAECVVEDRSDVVLSALGEEEEMSVKEKVCPCPEGDSARQPGDIFMI